MSLQGIARFTYRETSNCEVAVKPPTTFMSVTACRLLTSRPPGCWMATRTEPVAPKWRTGGVLGGTLHKRGRREAGHGAYID